MPSSQSQISVTGLNWLAGTFLNSTIFLQFFTIILIFDFVFKTKYCVESYVCY
jgi:hypothetical protein